MLFKWLFTLLALLWLWLVGRRLFARARLYVYRPLKPPVEPPVPSLEEGPSLGKGSSRLGHDDEGEYIEYEEVKD
jgi:hypothetical protein